MHNAHIRNGLGKVSFPILRAFGPYQWPLSDVITHLKFAQKVSYAKALGQLFSQHIAVNLPHPVDVIVPVPLSRRRYASRLFNQSIEIAKHIKASQADHHAAVMQVRHDAIVRNKHTQAQTNLTAYQRQQNVKGAFSIDALIQARRIAIFDDVITTGATTEAVYQLLKRTYPDTEIEVWSMCITLAR